MSVPGIVMKAATTMLKRSVRKKIAHKFDPNALAPKTFAPKCKCPALFGGDANDGVVPPSMVEKVFKKYSKKRRTLVTYECVGSGHFGMRPKEWFQQVHSFLLEHLYSTSSSTKQEKKKKKKKKKKEEDGEEEVATPSALPPAAVPVAIATAAQWPPLWVVTLNERLEINRNRANEAAALKKRSAAESQGETKGGDVPPAPQADMTADMMAVVGEDASLSTALGDFEEAALK